MKTSMLVLAMSGIVCLAVPVYSQDQPDEPQPRARGGRGALLRAQPVMAALDANQDNEISAEEIANAAEALKALDRDKNGKLTPDEVRPSFAGRRGVAGDGPAAEGFGQRRGPEGGFGGQRGFGRDGIDRGGPNRGGPDRAGRGRGFGGLGPMNPEQFVARAMEFDADKDGELDKAELTALAERLGGGFRGGFGDGGGFRGRPEGPPRPGDRRGDPRPRPDGDR